MSLLSVVQTFCTRTGLSIPSYVKASTDTQVLQIKGLLDEVLEHMVGKWDWEGLIKEATFTTVAFESQGAVTTLAPKAFNRILNETIFNRTLRLPIYGPLRADEWQARKALPTAGPYSLYRIRGGVLFFNPAPVAGQTCAFEYITNNCVTAADGSTPRTSFVDDTDISIWPDRLLVAGLRWKWKSEKGLDSTEELRHFEELMLQEYGSSGTKRRVSLDCSSASMTPGIFVTPGNWNL